MRNIQAWGGGELIGLESQIPGVDVGVRKWPVFATRWESKAKKSGYTYGMKKVLREKKQKRASVTDYPALHLADFGRDLLAKENGTYKRGAIPLRQLSEPCYLGYYVDVGSEGALLNVMRIGSYDFVSIRIEVSQSTFGTRPVLICPGCKAKRRILYHGRLTIRCRGCMNLRHEKVRHSFPLLHLLGDNLRIRQAQQRVKRITYRDAYTRRAARLMALLQKFNETVESHTISPK